MLNIATALPVTVTLAKNLQDYSLVNRGVLDTLGAAVPMVALARNENERREKILDRSIVIGSAFLLAPVHAWLIMRAVAKRSNIAHQLMTLSYKDLQSVESLKLGIQKLTQTVIPPLDLGKFHKKLNLPRHINEALRKKLINAKTYMLIPDLITECLIFANLGWMTNFFTLKLTGKHQFTGEMSAVPEKALDDLYQEDSEFQNDEGSRKLLTVGAAFAVPIALGLFLRKAMMTVPKKTGVLGRLLRKLKENAFYFDYKKGVWMSLSTLGVVIAMQFLGQVLAARSERERRENLIREGMLNVVFFWGNALWMRLISKSIFKRLKIPVETSIQKVMEKAPAGLKRKAGTIASVSYLGSFVLNTLSLSGVVVFNNHLTTQQVREDSAKLHAKNFLKLYGHGELRQKKLFAQYGFSKATLSSNDYNRLRGGQYHLRQSNRQAELQ